MGEFIYGQPLIKIYSYHCHFIISYLFVNLMHTTFVFQAAKKFSLLWCYTRYFTILSNLTWFLCYLLGEQARISFFVFKNSVKMKHEIIQLMSFSYVILKPWFYYFKKDTYMLPLNYIKAFTRNWRLHNFIKAFVNKTKSL